MMEVEGTLGALGWFLLEHYDNIASVVRFLISGVGFLLEHYGNIASVVRFLISGVGFLLEHYGNIASVLELCITWLAFLKAKGAKEAAEQAKQETSKALRRVGSNLVESEIGSALRLASTPGLNRSSTIGTALR